MISEFYQMLSLFHGKGEKTARVFIGSGFYPVNIYIPRGIIRNGRCINSIFPVISFKPQMRTGFLDNLKFL